MGAAYSSVACLSHFCTHLFRGGGGEGGERNEGEGEEEFAGNRTLEGRREERGQHGQRGKRETDRGEEVTGDFDRAATCAFYHPRLVAVERRGGYQR